MEYGCAVWSGGNTTGLKEIQDRFCKTHGIRLPDLQKCFDFLTLILFFKIRNKKCPQYLHNWLPPMFKATTSYNLRVRTDIQCLLCPSQVHCPVFYRELWCFGMIYPLRFKQPGLLHCSKKLSKNIFLFNSLSFVAWEHHNSWLSVCFFLFLFHPLSFLQFLSHPLRFPSCNFPLTFLSATNVTGA